MPGVTARVILHGDRTTVPIDALDRIQKWIASISPASPWGTGGLYSLVAGMPAGVGMAVMFTYHQGAVVSMVFVHCEGAILEYIEGGINIASEAAVLNDIPHGDTCVWVQSAARIDHPMTIDSMLDQITAMAKGRVHFGSGGHVPPPGEWVEGEEDLFPRPSEPRRKRHRRMWGDN